MKTHPNMSDDEWDAFLAAIPEEKSSTPASGGGIYSRGDCVTEEDLCWWNSMTKEEQEGLKKELQAQNLGLLMYLYKDMGMSATDALVKMHKSNAIYDDYPLSAQHIAELKKNGLREDDYPLPWVLSDRIGRYMGSLRPGTAEYRETQEMLNESTSANAAIRYFLSVGKI